MNIKNYTSSVPANDSIQRIEELLVEAGAGHISKSYVSGCVTGILFQLTINDMPLTFKLPAKVELVEKQLGKFVRKRTEATDRRVKAQAERTAWKLVYDWVQIQLSMIRLEQAEPAEMFFAYLYNPAKDQTIFGELKAANFNFKQLRKGGEE